jgi:lipopolysaccharide export LptBFGC system permease protein LptF
MFKNFKASEILIIVVVIIVIFVSEYLYLVVGDKDKAIFIGLWVPSILGFAIFLKLINQKND